MMAISMSFVQLQYAKIQKVCIRARAENKSNSYLVRVLLGNELIGSHPAAAINDGPVPVVELDTTNKAVDPSDVDHACSESLLGIEPEAQQGQLVLLVHIHGKDVSVRKGPRTVLQLVDQGACQECEQEDALEASIACFCNEVRISARPMSKGVADLEELTARFVMSLPLHRELTTHLDPASIAAVARGCRAGLSVDAIAASRDLKVLPVVEGDVLDEFAHDLGGALEVG